MTDSGQTSEVRRIQAVYAARDTRDRNEYRNSGFRLMVEERDQAFARLISAHLERPIAECRILDGGCGDGTQLAWLHERGFRAAHLHGIDLLPDQIRRARDRYPRFAFVEGNAEALPFSDAEFDLVVVMTAFSSILDRRMARNVAEEILRVLHPSGCVLWYDMRYPNPWNSNVRAMTRSRVQSLFPACTLRLQTITLVPQLARALDRLDEHRRSASYRRLATLPFMRSHLIGIIAPPRRETARRVGPFAG